MIKATRKDAYALMHEGTLAMAEMERVGIRVDLDYIKRVKRRINRQVKRYMKSMYNDEIYRHWKRKYKARTNLGSRDQLADILFNVMGVEAPDTMTQNRHKADADALEDVNLPFTKTYIKCEKLKKANGTYLTGIAREAVNGFIYPNFNLHLVRSYRGSSDHPNFTNMPIRDPLIKKLVRRAIRAREGHRIVDIDFKGSEVNAASWYHKDPVMLSYIADTSKDMHRDMAMELYCLSKKQVSGDIRHCSKNMFVFPQFYGDWWLSCAKSLWKAIDRQNLQTPDGIDLKKWLRKEAGITCLGTHDARDINPESFEAHVKGVEERFWYDRFEVYQDWKDSWWDRYCKRGYFDMLTGFRVSGYLGRKEVINYPIQGTAFHCLLWPLIEIGKALHKYKMKARLIGQIHDDVVADVPDKELKDYIDISLEIITVKLQKHWPWIITPMRVEVEVTPIGGSWYEKKGHN